MEPISQYEKTDLIIESTLSKDDHISVEIGNVNGKPNEKFYFCTLNLGDVSNEKYTSWCEARNNCTYPAIFPLMGHIHSIPNQVLISRSFNPLSNNYQNENELKFWEKYQFSKEDKVKTILRITKGVQFLHSRGIYGIELSPLGIEIDPATKDVYFGINRVKDIETNNPLMRFYPPESLKYLQSNSQKKQSISAEYQLQEKGDAYQYGLIVYSLLTGNLPFSTKNNNIEIIQEFLLMKVLLVKMINNIFLIIFLNYFKNALILILINVLLSMKFYLNLKEDLLILKKLELILKLHLFKIIFKKIKLYFLKKKQFRNLNERFTVY